MAATRVGPHGRVASESLSIRLSQLENGITVLKIEITPLGIDICSLESPGLPPEAPIDPGRRVPRRLRNQGHLARVFRRNQVKLVLDDLKVSFIGKCCLPDSSADVNTQT